jgi:phage gpG-like protein
MAKGRVKTTRKKTPYGERVDAFFRFVKNKDPHVIVGWPEEVGKVNHEMGPLQENAKTPLKIAEIATIHEFGAPEAGIPERSMLRANDFKNKKKYLQVINRLTTEVFEGKMKPINVLEVVGLMVVSDVKNRIREGIEPALKPETIRRKGSSKPLIDTGQLVNSVSHQVKTKGDK